MEVVKKITIIAVLIASVMLIINLFDDTSEEVKEYADTKKSEIRKNLEERRLEREEEERWNNLTAEEKCEEARETTMNFQVEASDMKIDNPEAEWVDQLISRRNQSLLENVNLLRIYY